MSIEKKIKNLSTQEKIMLGFLLLLILGILLQWKNVKEGIIKGFEPYKQKTESTE